MPSSRGSIRSSTITSAGILDREAVAIQAIGREIREAACFRGIRRPFRMLRLSSTIQDQSAGFLSFTHRTALVLQLCERCRDAGAGRVKGMMRHSTADPHATARPIPADPCCWSASNIFMTFAWYGHLKYRSTPAAAGDPGQLGHRLRIPAAGARQPPGSAVCHSRAAAQGHAEVITLLVFAGFSTWYLGQPLKWNHWAASP